MPNIGHNHILSQNPNQAGLSEFQKAFSAKTKKEIVFRDESRQNIGSELRR